MNMSQGQSGCCGGGSCETTGGAGAAQPQSATRRKTYTPPVDVIETLTEFQVRADVPGATADQVDITLEDGTLTLRAGVTDRYESVPGFISREYGVGPYERSFRVGEGIDADAIAAELVNGILTVRLPKSAEARPRRIAVRGS